MLNSFALTSLALALLQLAQDSGVPIATDKELATSVRLIETDDSILFQFEGPDNVVPSVAIDVNRNGLVDRQSDFQVGRHANGSPCLQMLLREGASSTCKPYGDKASWAESRNGEMIITTVRLPKQAVSGDGFGFGFAIELGSKSENFGKLIASGDYRFGGTLNLLREGPNFKGERMADLPLEMLPAVRRYQGCLALAMKALEPIEASVMAKLKEIPSGCAGQRASSVTEGVEALVAAGVAEVEAKEAMLDVLGQLDAGFSTMIETLEKGFRS